MLWIALRDYLPAGVSLWLLVFAAFLGAAIVLLLASVLLVVGRHGRWLWLAVIVWAVAFGAFEVYAWATFGYFAWVPVAEELVFVVYAAVVAIAFLVTPFFRPSAFIGLWVRGQGDKRILVSRLLSWDS